MDHMWDTTWYEDLLGIAFLFLAFYSFAVLIYGLGASVMAPIGHFAHQGVVVFWVVIVVALTLFLFGFPLSGIVFYVCASPISGFCLGYYERRRKRIQTNQSTEHEK